MHRASGKIAQTTNVHPSRWCRKAERWKSQSFCSWTRKAAPETTNAIVIPRRHQSLRTLPRTSASSVAPPSISTCAQTPCASMCSVELVKKTITGHRSTPSANAMPGHRYPRQARCRQTSVPTTASPSRQRPRIRKPVANSQWTCSAGGCTRLLEVFEQSRQHDEVEEEPDCDHEQRRLHEQPPEAFAARMQQRDAIRLHDGPDHADERRQRAECRHDPYACSSMLRYFEFGNELCVHSSLPQVGCSDLELLRLRAAGAGSRTRARRGRAD